MQKKSITHRKLVYEVARKFIFEMDIRAWSMDMLAAEADITKRTLYRIVPSKESLVEEVMLEMTEEIYDQFTSIIENGNDYLSTLEEITRALSTSMSKTIISLSWQRIFSEYPSIQNSVIQRRDEINAVIIDFIKVGIDNGALRSDLSPEFVAEMGQALFFYFLHISGDEDTLRENFIKAFHHLIHGITA